MSRGAPGLLAAAVLALGTNACLMGPRYQRPPVAQPGRFRFASGAEARSLADLPWWELFRDPALSELLSGSLEQNYDIRVAAWRVEEARALAGIDRWSLYPSFGASASANTGRRRIGGSGALPSQGSYAVNAQVAWELDVWGKLRRQREASVATFQAALDLRRAIASSLVADVAQAYFELLGLDLQREILESTIENRQASLQLYQSRLDSGVGSAVEVNTGRAQLFEAQAMRATVVQQSAQKENQISVLLGRPPDVIRRGPPLMAQQALPAIPPGLPSALLERRPDVQAAEQQLVAANARVGVAQASFFPQISLTGALGFISPTLSRLFTGDAAGWNAGGIASVLAPLLGGHALIDQKDAAVARFEQAKATYALAVVVALQEVADALVAEQQLRARIEFLELQVSALEERRRLAMSRFRGGVASYLEVTTAEESLLPAKLSLAVARISRSIAVVQLYRALGGGWQEKPPPAAAPTGAGAEAPKSPP